MIINADALKQSWICENCIDLTVTSPPYNLDKTHDDKKDYSDYLKFTHQWLTNCFFWTKSTGRLCVNVALDTNKFGKQPLASDVTKIAIEVGWKYHATIIWNEGNISRRTAWGSWKSASAPHVIAPVEVIIVLYKGNWKRAQQGESDITADEFKDWTLGLWTFPGESAKRIGHKAPFPRELPKRCIKLFSFVGDIILDPFLGSGTTLIEALANKRRAVGIELDEDYCELAKCRWFKTLGVTNCMMMKDDIYEWYGECPYCDMGDIYISPCPVTNKGRDNGKGIINYGYRNNI